MMLPVEAPAARRGSGGGTGGGRDGPSSLHRRLGSGSKVSSIASSMFSLDSTAVD